MQNYIPSILSINNPVQHKVGRADALEAANRLRGMQSGLTAVPANEQFGRRVAAEGIIKGMEEALGKERKNELLKELDSFSSAVSFVSGQKSQFESALIGIERNMMALHRAKTGALPEQKQDAIETIAAILETSKNGMVASFALQVQEMAGVLLPAGQEGTAKVSKSNIPDVLNAILETRTGIQNSLDASVGKMGEFFGSLAGELEALSPKLPAVIYRFNPEFEKKFQFIANGHERSNFHEGFVP